MDVVTFSIPVTNAVSFGVQAVSPLSVSIPLAAGYAPPYTGDYEVTPTQQTQTFPTYGKLMTGNFIVNPIPSNYGLITWNGSTLTVS